MDEGKKEDKFIAFVRKHEGLVRFLFIGSVNTLLDLFIYAILANLLSVRPVIASICSTGITLVLSYFMNHYFVFHSKNKKRHTALQFIAVTLFNVWAIQSSIIALVIHSLNGGAYFAHHEWTLNMFAKLCGVSVSLVLNYIGYKYIFKQRGRKA